MSAHAAALEILRKTSDPNAFRKIAEQQHQSLNSYETHLENDEFHGPPPTFDPKAYFELLPFKFRCAEVVKEAPVVLPPWSTPPKQLCSILQKLGCSTKSIKVPRIATEGAMQGLCLQNAMRLVEHNGGGCVVIGYAIFQGTKHWYLERHAVYMCPDGRFVDPTPPLFNPEIEPHTCFVAEPGITVNNIKTMQRAHTVWMDRHQLKWMVRNKWYGGSIFMSGPSTPCGNTVRRAETVRKARRR